MAEYKGIKGFKVQTVSTDPAASIPATGSWASGGNLNTTRAACGGAGVQTAVIAISGIVTNAPSVATVNNESYDGSAWTEVNNVNTARLDTHAVGSATAALLFGGSPPYTNATESWNGTNWTTVNSLNTPRASHTGFGTSTAGLCISGLTSVDILTGNVESWNGSAWTEITDVNQARAYLSSSTNAPQSDAIVFGGTIFPGPFTAATESWNGSAWTELNDLNTAIANGSGAGISTSALMIAGSAPAITNTTEGWDGTNWSTLSNQANSLAYKNRGGGGASSSVAITFSGSNSPAFTTPTFVNSTEEWTTTPAPTFQKENLGQVFYNSTANAFKVTKQSITAGTWASGGNMNTGRASTLVNSVSGGLSGQTNAIGASGASPPGTNLTNVELYNGSTWTETTDVNTGRRLGGGAGGQPAAVIAGGYATADTGATEIWNGSTWTETTDLNTPRRQFAGSFGTTDSSSDLLVCGAFTAPGPRPTNTEIWNGSSWTEVNDLNTGRNGGASMGASTLAGLVAGGQSSPSPTSGQTAFAESWNGTSWTEVAEFNTSRQDMAGAGIQTDGIIFGGQLDPGTTAKTEYWNGTSWTELNDLATAVTHNSGGGSTGAGISFGGANGANATEEWNAGAINSTLTAS